MSDRTCKHGQTPEEDCTGCAVEAERDESELVPPTGSVMPTLESVTGAIIRRAAKFEADYGIKPFDVVLGPAEFDVLKRQSNLPDSDPSSKWRLEAAVYFFKGMRIRLAACEGIMVGCLTAKEMCDHEFDAEDLPCAYCGKTAEELGLSQNAELSDGPPKNLKL